MKKVLKKFDMKSESKPKRVNNKFEEKKIMFTYTSGTRANHAANRSESDTQTPHQRNETTQTQPTRTCLTQPNAPYSYESPLSVMPRRRIAPSPKGRMHRVKLVRTFNKVKRISPYHPVKKIYHALQPG